MEYYSKPTLITDDIVVFPLSWSDFDSINLENRAGSSPYLDIPWNLMDFFWWVEQDDNTILIEAKEVEVNLKNENGLTIKDCSVFYDEYDRYISYKGCGELWFSRSIRQYIKRTLNFWKDDNSDIKVNLILTSVKVGTLGGTREGYETYNFEIKAFGKDGSELILNTENSINQEATNSTEKTEHYSWKKTGNKIVKTLDYSAFNEKGSGIPKAFYDFFNLKSEVKINVDLRLKNSTNYYYALISWKRKQPNQSTAVITWGNDFLTLLKQIFPKWDSIEPHDKDSKMGLVFTKTDEKNFYVVSFEGNKFEMTFGHIEGVAEGQIFSNREELGQSGIHTPPMHGIWGREAEGSASIVISGGYTDDIDEGDYILYTGQGGQDTPGGKQIKDQEFTRGNRGLQLNKEYNLPVRVTRGYQVEKGPNRGYRYDGLYYVTDYERVEGKEGFLVCRFHLQKEKEDLPTEDAEHPTSPPERMEYSGNRLKRNIKFAEQIKELYNNTCQVCKKFLKTPINGIGISEAAHIKAIGKPHNGPDTKANMFCLCPNHHAQFDRYSFYIDPDNFEIVGLDDFEGQFITPMKHRIKSEYFEYQKQQYLKNKQK